MSLNLGIICWSQILLCSDDLFCKNLDQRNRLIKHFFRSIKGVFDMYIDRSHPQPLSEEQKDIQYPVALSKLEHIVEI